MSVTGWKLDEGQRQALLERFAPEWPDVIAGHLTLDAAAEEEGQLRRAEVLIGRGSKFARRPGQGGTHA